MSNKSIKKQIGKRLRAIREKYKFTQKKMASFFPGYIRNDTLSRYESGDSTPDIEFVVLFCKKFDLNPYWLFFGTGPQQVSGKGEPRKPQEVYFELIDSINREALPFKEISLDSMPIENIPENYIELIKVMNQDEELRTQIFKIFFLALHKDAVQRIESKKN